MELRKVIFELCAAHGVSGSEESVFEVAEGYLAPLSRQTGTDANGNFFAVLGNPEAKKTILLDAHLDRIGLMVTDINENGFVKVDKCGGMDIRTLQNTVFETETGLKGTVCCLPPHLSDGSEDKATPISKTWLDFGLPADKVRERIRIGDKLVFSVKPASLLGGKITAPALDNRCGVAALLRVAEMIYDREVPYRVVILLSSQEETFGTGAVTGAFAIDADEAISVDVSFAGQPDIAGQYAGIGLKKGPMLGISPILSKAMTNQLAALAREKEIPIQWEPIAGRTGTNADKIALTKSGVRTALLSIPERYMHTQAEVIHPDDVENTALLIAEYILCGGVFDA